MVSDDSLKVKRRGRSARIVDEEEEDEEMDPRIKNSDVFMNPESIEEDPPAQVRRKRLHHQANLESGILEIIKSKEEMDDSGNPFIAYEVMTFDGRTEWVSEQYLFKNHPDHLREWASKL